MSGRILFAVPCARCGGPVRSGQAVTLSNGVLYHSGPCPLVVPPPSTWHTPPVVRR